MERPAKRARLRQACEPCRRKKSRCPGERPVCSYCARLGQFCNYADEIAPENQNPAGEWLASPQSARQPRVVEDRLSVLETQIARVLSAISEQHPQDQNGHRSHPPTPGPSSQVAVTPSHTDQSPHVSNNNLPQWKYVTDTAEHYLAYCDCQPLPLFHRDTFLATLRERDHELLFAMLALALRFSDDPYTRENIPTITNQYAELSRSTVMRRVSEGPIELSTLQSLCLLSLVDFTNGNKHRASIHSSLAMNLAHCAGLTSESNMVLSEIAREERRRCFWSIFLLKRLHGADVSVLDFSGEENFPWYPNSKGTSAVQRPSLDRSYSGAVLSGPSQDRSKDAGIVAYFIQLSEVWFKATRYALRRGKPSTLPPWSPQSEYATIVTQQMEFETRVPYFHRYKPAEFSKKSSDELYQNRDYWGPWLSVQFLYHTILCLLNHPLLLALRLRNFPNMIPEIFLQHSSDLISSHTSWISHHIEVLEAKSFKVTDPFLAHCAAIVATIYLQESFVGDAIVRREKHFNFVKCLNFIRGFGEQWPHCERLATKLANLEETISASYHSLPHHDTNDGLVIDLSRFWEILEYSSASELPELTPQLFGSSLYTVRNATTEVSNTSALPAPTRVESAVQGDRMDRDVGPPAVESGFQDAAGNGNGNAGGVAEFAYLDDDLAVLADGFFSQRNDFVGNVHDWWRTGNL